MSAYFSFKRFALLTNMQIGGGKLKDNDGMEDSDGLGGGNSPDNRASLMKKDKFATNKSTNNNENSALSG